MEVLQVTDYDILANELPDGTFDLDAYHTHIGNSRFNVLVDMYHEAYDMSHVRGKDDECKKIVQRIIDVACHKDVSVIVTKGRFLVKVGGEGNWKKLEGEKENELVHQELMAPPAEEVSVAESVPSKNFSIMAINNAAINDKKRGRRRSLLRRSASESTMMEDKKKTYRLMTQGLDYGSDDDEPNNDLEPLPIAEPSLTRLSTTDARGGPMPPIAETTLSRSATVPIQTGSSGVSANSGPIQKHEGMDIVVASNGRSFWDKETVVGNNRLQVLLSLQEDRSEGRTSEEQDKVAADLLKAVVQFWKGRMLIEQGFGFRKLNEEESMNVIKGLLSPDDKSIKLPTPNGSGALLNAPPPPDFLRNASMELLATTGSVVAGPGDVRSVAVESLRQRKAKRALTKGLGKGRSIPEHFSTVNEN